MGICLAVRGVAKDLDVCVLAIPTSITGVALICGANPASWVGVLGCDSAPEGGLNSFVVPTWCGLRLGFLSGAIEVASESVVSSVRVDACCDAVFEVVEAVRR